jgi:hypothetical protein
VWQDHKVLKVFRGSRGQEDHKAQEVIKDLVDLLAPQDLQVDQLVPPVPPALLAPPDQRVRLDLQVPLDQ